MFRGMEAGLLRGLPCNLHGFRSLTAEEVDTETMADPGFAGFNRGERNPHGPIPDIPILLNASGNLETGLPGSKGDLVRLLQIDIEIEPFALRGQFELSIAVDRVELGTDEGLRHIPVPETTRGPVQYRVRLEMQLFIRAEEEKVQIGGRPARTHLGIVPGNFVPVCIVSHMDSRRTLPKRGKRVGIRSRIMLGML